MKIIANLRKNDVKYIKTFTCWDLYFEYTFDPNIEILEVTVEQ